MVNLRMFYLNINYLFLIIFCEWEIWLSKIGLTTLKIGSVGSIKPPTYHLCHLKPTAEKNWNICFKQILRILIIESKPCLIVELVILFIAGGKVDKLATQTWKCRVMVQLLKVVKLQWFHHTHKVVKYYFQEKASIHPLNQ